MRVCGGVGVWMVGCGWLVYAMPFAYSRVSPWIKSAQGKRCRTRACESVKRHRQRNLPFPPTSPLHAHVWPPQPSGGRRDESNRATTGTAGEEEGGRDSPRTIILPPLPCQNLNISTTTFLPSSGLCARGMQFRIKLRQLERQRSIAATGFLRFCARTAGGRRFAPGWCASGRRGGSAPSFVRSTCGRRAMWRSRSFARSRPWRFRRGSTSKTST